MNAGRWPRRWPRRLLFFFPLAAVVYGAVLYRHILRESTVDDAQPADAIVVFGAAQYSGRPSPVYRARLDHAYDLFQRGLAPFVITTGGAGGDPTFNEGSVGRDYLVARGVPEPSIIAETQSSDTEEAARRVAVIMRANGLHSCVTVSDDYHMFRIRRMLESKGLEVHGSPRPQGASGWERSRLVLREVVSYVIWRFGELATW
ncbi:MAG TPA: YdcF family protein [Terriglobales bacterium]|nr:YdcF family protein [Terriglobales bacterium]